MAFCPSCKGEIGQTATICPHCGYDFPKEDFRAERRGIAYSLLADIALIAGQVVAGLGCALTLGGSIVALCYGDLVHGLVVGPLAFFVLLANLVVFVRVQRL